MKVYPYGKPRGRRRDSNSLLDRVRVCLAQEPTLSTNELFVILRPNYETHNPRYLRRMLTTYRCLITRKSIRTKGVRTSTVLGAVPAPDATSTPVTTNND